MKTIFEFLKDESGPTATEYGVMLVLVIVVCVTVITALGQKVSQNFSNVDSGF